MTTPDSALTKAVHFLVRKVLKIDSHEQRDRQSKDLDERAKHALGSTYVEEEPTVWEWFRQLVPTSRGAIRYVEELFPSARWVPRYNLHWLLGDVIAGLTVGFVVVPQALAYALLARLSPEYGLYTSFVGAAIYWLFGTSKDIVIGTTAIGSLLVGNVITKVEEKKPDVYQKEDIAKALSIAAGAVLLLLGFLRLGWIIEFIPYVPISAFVTAASITIMSTQFPVALGIKGVNTREAPYKVIINTLKRLDKIKLDASIGLTSIVLLSIIRSFCAKMEVRHPAAKRTWALVSSLRLTFTILLFTFVSWLVHRDMPKGSSKFRIVGHIESGFKHSGVPKLDGELVSLVIPELPAMVIILVIEHIAIAKSFGRIFNYTVSPSQEILSQGTANVLGAFVGGYVCTGSFGASAVLSKAGVRTPLAGLYSALVLVLALYALTSVFYYIPMAALAGLIIHAVANLLTPPRSLYKYWLLSPFELIIWIVGVVLALFTNLETSIYATIGLSLALLLIRLARSQGRFLARVRIYQVSEEPIKENGHVTSPSVKEELPTSRDAFLPLDRNDASNPNVIVEHAYPGVFIYRFAEGLSYVNQAQHIDHLQSYIIENTRPTKVDDDIKPYDRLWNDTGPLRGNERSSDSRPLLRAVVLDCSAVNNIDITAVQGLIDLRNNLDRYAVPAMVEWHFAGVLNRWTRRALAVAGFGYPTSTNSAGVRGNWSPAYTVATSLAGATQDDERKGAARDKAVEAADEERSDSAEQGENKSGMISPCTEHSEHSHGIGSGNSNGAPQAPVHGVDRPFFHIDLVEAVDAAVRHAQAQDHRRAD